MITVPDRLRPFAARLRGFDAKMLEVVSNLVNYLPPGVDATAPVFNFPGSIDAIARLRDNETGLEVLLEMTKATFCPILHFARHAEAIAAMTSELNRIARNGRGRRGRRTSGKCGFRRSA